MVHMMDCAAAAGFYFTAKKLTNKYRTLVRSSLYSCRLINHDTSGLTDWLIDWLLLTVVQEGLHHQLKFKLHMQTGSESLMLKKIIIIIIIGRVEARSSLFRFPISFSSSLMKIDTQKRCSLIMKRGGDAFTCSQNSELWLWQTHDCTGRVLWRKLNLDSPCVTGRRERVLPKQGARAGPRCSTPTRQHGVIERGLDPYLATSLRRHERWSVSLSHDPLLRRTLLFPPTPVISHAATSCEDAEFLKSSVT